MARFATSQELDQVIGGFLRRLPRLDPILREITDHSPLLLKLELKDPPLAAEIDLTATPLVIRMETSAVGTVGMAGRADDFQRVLLGLLPVAKGINEKKLLARGSTAKLMKAVPLFYVVPYIYPSYLESIGRADLIEMGEYPPLHADQPVEGIMNQIVAAMAYGAGYLMGFIKQRIAPHLDILAALEAMGQGLRKAAPPKSSETA